MLHDRPSMETSPGSWFLLTFLWFLCIILSRKTTKIFHCERFLVTFVPHFQWSKLNLSRIQSVLTTRSKGLHLRWGPVSQRYRLIFFRTIAQWPFSTRGGCKQSVYASLHILRMDFACPCSTRFQSHAYLNPPLTSSMTELITLFPPTVASLDVLTWSGEEGASQSSF